MRGAQGWVPLPLTDIKEGPRVAAEGFSLQTAYQHISYTSVNRIQQKPGLHLGKATPQSRQTLILLLFCAHLVVRKQPTALAAASSPDLDYERPTGQMLPSAHLLMRHRFDVNIHHDPARAGSGTQVTLACNDWGALNCIACVRFVINQSSL
ncbi:hypothetical protein B0F90DRAFT_343716 [Multifurca ochricompacta]|uniref:Uncharacterized protein n=1 Tax=Multifurca ochricompacta TaxID=376703 RepID=A0AAD4QL09_9AGAM|nr:hypothetical protein B0F90DRAFT_343716 [Multifurca ochricompacta]